MKNKFQETLFVTNKTESMLVLSRAMLWPGEEQAVVFKKKGDMLLAVDLHEKGIVSIRNLKITPAKEKNITPKEVKEVKEESTAPEEAKIEPVTLREEEIKEMSKKEALAFMKDNVLDLGVNSRTGATEITNALLKHFGFEELSTEE